MPLSMEEYLNKARQMYDPGYNERTAAENNSANLEIANQDNQIGSINQSYGQAINDNKQTTAFNQNGFSNNTLNRGMGRSSIAVTGLADLANQGAEREVRINNEKTDKLNQIESLKNTIRANLQSKLTGMKSDYETGVRGLAQQYYDTDLNYERDLAKAKAASRSSGSSSSKNNNTISDKDKGNNATKLSWEEFLNQLNNGTGGAWLNLYESDLKSSIGTEEVKKMRAAYDTVAAKKSREEATDRGNVKQKYLEESQGYSIYNQ